MKKNVLDVIVIASIFLSACRVPARPNPPPALPAATESTAADLPPPVTPASPAEANPLPEETTDKLDAFLQTQVITASDNPLTSTPGLVLLVETPQGRYLNAAGVSNLEQGTPMKADDRLEIGSISKAFTAVVLTQLQEAGVLSWDDPLSRWLPEVAERIPNGDKMTLRQLGQHTSGVWDYGDPIVEQSAMDPETRVKGYTPEDIIQYVLDNGKPDFEPGKGWKYSNTGYILLGMVAEKASGKTLKELYQAQIFDPLELKSAVMIEGVPAEGEVTSQGYWWDDSFTGPIAPYTNTTAWNASQGWAAGAIAMNAADLATFGKALLDGKPFKNPESLEQMLQFNDGSLKRIGFPGYGLALIDFGNGSIGHSGQTPGYVALWATDPKTGITLVGLSNSASYLSYRVFNALEIVNSAEAASASATPAATPIASADSATVTDTITTSDDAMLNDPDDIAQMAQLNPPPKISERAAGITQVPCDLAALQDAGEVEGETYYCGVFTVPQNWMAPDRRNLDLFFMVVKASGPNSEPDPLVFLAGGPGQSSVLASIEHYAKIRETRDIVRMDQRGTGLSQRVDVPECLVSALASGSGQDKVAALLPYLTATDVQTSSNSLQRQVNQICWDQFTSAGLDLNQFTTANAAHDLVELIKALGYKRYNMHGISYGTRLAMTVLNGIPGMDDAPEVRSAVIDSANPPSVRVLAELPRTKHDQVVQMLEDCENDDACRAAYPRLKQRLGQLLTQLAQNPLVVGDKTVTLPDVAAQLKNLVYTRPAYMPRMISELERGVLDTYLALESNSVGAADPSEGGLDMSDPVQAFIVDALRILSSSGGGADVAMAFVVNLTQGLVADDPITTMTESIKTNYEEPVQKKLLDRLSQLTAKDFENSPYVVNLRKLTQADAAKTQDEEAKQERQARLLALSSLATMLNRNIHCHEDFQFTRYEDALAVYHDLVFPQLADLNNVRVQLTDCDGWPVVAAPITVKDPVSSTTPALILQGAYDVATPVYSGLRASRELSNSIFALVPRQGHEVWTPTSACVTQIATDFVLDPSRSPDQSCLEARRLQWVMPNDKLTDAAQ